MDFQCDDFGNVRSINTWGWGVLSTAVTTTTFKAYSNEQITKTVNNTTKCWIKCYIYIDTMNAGISNDTNVIVTDILPSGYSYVSSSASVGTYNNITGIWNIGTFNNGSTATLSIVATVRASGNYVNNAIISGTNTEFNSANNTASAFTTPMLVY